MLNAFFIIQGVGQNCKHLQISSIHFLSKWVILHFLLNKLCKYNPWHLIIYKRVISLLQVTYSQDRQKLTAQTHGVSGGLVDWVMTPWIYSTVCAILIIYTISFHKWISGDNSSDVKKNYLMHPVVAHVVFESSLGHYTVTGLVGWYCHLATNLLAARNKLALRLPTS